MALNKVHVKKGDTVVVLSGKDRGKKGKVLKVMAQDGKVIVENVNMVTKHEKPSKKVKQGGIIHQEAPIYSSKVSVYCPTCGAGRRFKTEILGDGTKVRKCVKCGEILGNQK
ncbi:MAG TPA: 50S ribosomal protein L24 [Clostridiaceae bacterium]|nr:50S ribosomal protein L24 [Clostridiaceae bacterium]